MGRLDSMSTESVSKLFIGWSCNVVNRRIIIVYHNVFLKQRLVEDHRIWHIEHLTPYLLA